MPRATQVSKRSQWLDRMRRFSRSKLSVTEFCRKEQVSTPSFYRWRQVLSDSAPPRSVHHPSEPARFLPVQVTSSLDLHVTLPNGVRLTLPTQDHELVRMSLETLAHVSVAGDE